MKKIRVFINGLGRIGRVFIRQNFKNPNIDIVGLNDPNISSKNLEYLLEFDSTYGRIENRFKYFSDNKIIINKKKISITKKISLDKINFKADILLDCSGIVDTSHLRNLQTISKEKAKYVVVTNDINDFQPLIIGVNDQEINLSKRIFTSSICDTVASAPIIDCLQNNLDIISGKITTLHPYLNYQKLLDGAEINNINDSFVMGRSSLNSILPKNTSVVYSLNKIFNGINNKIHCMSFRVPTSIVSCGIMDLEISKSKLTKKKIISMLKKYSKSKKNLINFIDKPLTSIDYLGSVYATNIDTKWIDIINKNKIQLVYWYDNEWGYVNSICKLIDFIKKNMKF